jgi:hypothetical protein
MYGTSLLDSRPEGTNTQAGEDLIVGGGGISDYDCRDDDTDSEQKQGISLCSCREIDPLLGRLLVAILP